MNIHFRKIIIEKLKSKGMSRKKLAEKIGISKSYFDQLLINKKRLNEEIEKRICTALEIEIEYKITKEEELVE